MSQQGESPEFSGPVPEEIYSTTGELLALRYDVVGLLEAEVGEDWQQRIAEVIEAGELEKREPGGHYTNREHNTVAKLGLITADPDLLAERTPGVWRLYQGEFRGMMERAVPVGAEALKAYTKPGPALEGLAYVPVQQTGSDEIQYRMEAHVDEKYTAVLIIDCPEPSQGGRLVIGSDPDAQTMEEIRDDPNATIIVQRPGTLVCFAQGRKYPHFVEEITGGRRILISLNYPVESESEEKTEEFLKYIKSAKD